MSSLGSHYVNLDSVAFVTGVSGKGLLSYTGVAFVFHQEYIGKNSSLPRYIDLGTYADAESVPYTQLSNLLVELNVALKKYV